jgi:hypothetical protein
MDYLLFDPRDAKREYVNLHDVPRYLFRLYDATSTGTTNAEMVISHAATQTTKPTFGQKDLFSMPPSEAADLLNQHLQWDFRHDTHDNLMSWSTSLLFVLQYGLFRSVTEKCGKSELSDIFLCIVDTRVFPQGTFLQDLSLIKTYQNEQHSPSMGYTLRQLRWLREDKGYYFGEYLSQGRLDIKGKSRHTSLGRMVQLGLYHLCPGLSESEFWSGWAKRVVELRKKNFDVPQPRPTSASEARKAITIAQACFGDALSLPVAAMLLGLRARPRDDEVVVKPLLACFSGKCYILLRG